MFSRWANLRVLSSARLSYFFTSWNKLFVIAKMKLVGFLVTSVVTISSVLSQFGNNFGSPSIVHTSRYHQHEHPNQRNLDHDLSENYQSGYFEPQTQRIIQLQPSSQTQQLSAPSSSCDSFWSIQSENNEKFGFISVPSPDFRKIVLRAVVSVATQIPPVSHWAHMVDVWENHLILNTES